MIKNMTEDEKLKLINETMESQAFMFVNPTELFDLLKELADKVQQATIEGVKK